MEVEWGPWRFQALTRFGGAESQHKPRGGMATFLDVPLFLASPSEFFTCGKFTQRSTAGSANIGNLAAGWQVTQKFLTGRSTTGYLILAPCSKHKASGSQSALSAERA